MTDELDTLIEELAKEISERYGAFGKAIYKAITTNKEEIKTWLKTNKKRLTPILKKL